MSTSFFIPLPTVHPVTGDNGISREEFAQGVTLTGTAARGHTVTLSFSDGTVIKSGIPTRDRDDGSKTGDWAYTMTEADMQRLDATRFNGDQQLITVQSHKIGEDIGSPQVDHLFDLRNRYRGASLYLLKDTGKWDGITSNPNVEVQLYGQKARALEYQDNEGPFTAIQESEIVTVKGEGNHRITLRTTSANGDVDTSTLSFTLDQTAPSKPLLQFIPEAELSDDERQSNTRIVKVSGVDEDAHWQWSTNQGLSWNASASDSRVELRGPGVRTLMIKAIDRAGNESISTIDSASFDAAARADAPPPPVLRLKYDWGKSWTDRITNAGIVMVDSIPQGSTWQWSRDQGKSWNTPNPEAGNTFEVKDDGVHNVTVKVTDANGKESFGSLDFVLDTVIPARTVRYLYSWDRENISQSSHEEPWVSTVISYPRALDDSYDKQFLQQYEGPGGEISGLDLPAGLKIRGLYLRPQNNPSTEGLYRLLSAEEAGKLTHAFSGDFSADGKTMLDVSRPVYELKTGSTSWYLWAALGGEYIVSRLDGSHEWYRALSSTSPLPEQAKDWVAMTAPLPQVLKEQALNNGATSHQWSISNEPITSFSETIPETDTNLNGKSGTWSYIVEQTDLAGNHGYRYFSDYPYYQRPSFLPKFEKDTRPPSLLDLDAHTKGVQFNLGRPVTTDALSEGVAFAPDLAMPLNESVFTIELVLSGAGLDLAHDRILIRKTDSGHSPFYTVYPFELPLNVSTEIGLVLIGGRANNLRYDAASRTITITSHLNPPYNIMWGEWVKDVLSDISLINTAGTPGERTLSIKLIDTKGLASQISTVTLDASPASLWLDLDAQQEEIQLASARHVRKQSEMVDGVAFSQDVARPSATDIRGLQVRFSGNGLDVAKDRIQLDVALDLNKSLDEVNGKTIGGIQDLLYRYDAPSKTLTIGSTDDTRYLSGAQIKSIVEAIRLTNDNAMDGERVAQFRLISRHDQAGAEATARLILDTQAPVLDLDYNTAGVQSKSAKVINLARALKGEGLFQKAISAPVADDIDSITLVLSGPRAAADRDTLTWANDSAATTVIHNNSGGDGQTIGGVQGMHFSYDQASRALVFRKSSGAALNGMEVKSVLEAIKFQSSSKLAGERIVDISLTDQAGHTSSAKAVIDLDMSPPPKLRAEWIAGKQISYQVMDLGDTLGKINPHNLSKDESVTLPLPKGMSAQSFLAALQGISAEWGGLGISSNANTTYKDLKSFAFFNSPLESKGQFVLQHQSATSVKGGRFSFALSDDGKQLTLTNHGGFFAPNTDVYEYSGPTGTAMKYYDIGNVRLLYRVETDNASSMPMIRTHYDGRTAAVGDVISLYDHRLLLATKTLTEKDIGKAESFVTLTPDASLEAGLHKLYTVYSEASGNSSRSNTVETMIEQSRAQYWRGGVRARLTADMIELDQSTGHDWYSDIPPYHRASYGGTKGSAGHYETGPSYSVDIEDYKKSEQWLVVARMGGKLLGFDVLDPDLTESRISTAANLLPPGVYDDLSLTVTDLTAGSKNGWTSVWRDSQAIYWAPQSMGNTSGGHRDDTIPLGRTRDGAGTVIQTGAGSDTLVLGSFGKSGDFAATISDFLAGTDKITVFGKSIDLGNLNQFVKETAPIQGGNGTKVVVDLDGAAAGTQTYTLHLQNVAYNPANTHTLFGV